MELAKNIRLYYLKHFQELPFDKQLHFAGRLYSWNNDPECGKLISELGKQYINGVVSADTILSELINKPPSAQVNAPSLREPYFAKYHELRGLMLALFRVRHLLYYYNIDVRQDFVDIKQYDDLHSLAETLIHDKDAMRALSTYAVNYIYLVDHILFDVGSNIIDVEYLFNLGDGYDVENKDELMLLIYLYTHCIIGETNYYERGIKPERIGGYTKMLDKLEKLIEKHYENINLDSKLEFLACCRIMNYQTALFETIYAECAESISLDGDFLVDRLNKAGQTNKTTFEQSEHRNVLFIMSTLKYQHA